MLLHLLLCAALSLSGSSPASFLWASAMLSLIRKRLCMYKALSCATGRNTLVHPPNPPKFPPSLPNPPQLSPTPPPPTLPNRVNHWQHSKTVLNSHFLMVLDTHHNRAVELPRWFRTRRLRTPTCVGMRDRTRQCLPIALPVAKGIL